MDGMGTIKNNTPQVFFMIKIHYLTEILWWNLLFFTGLCTSGVIYLYNLGMAPSQ